MASDLVIYGGIAAGVASAVAFGFTLPALTDVTGGSSGPAATRSAIASQHSYCEKNMGDVNCVCFAQKAGQVLAHESPQVMGFAYADRFDLAQGQGRSGC